MPTIAKPFAPLNLHDPCRKHSPARLGACALRWIALGLFCVPVVAQQTVPWLTRGGSNDRGGWNSHETQLTQNSVITKGVSLVTVVPLCCDARGMEAQPLILPNVNTAKGKRDVMILPSMSDSVRGVDAHTGEDIWDVPLGRSIDSSGKVDLHLINEHWGCLSTGVIDPDTARDYQVCWISPDNSGNPETARYFLFGLNVADGKQPIAPVLIDGLDFNSDMRKARSSSVLIRPNGVKTILQCTGTVKETAAGASGYCFAFDIASNKITAMISTIKGKGAGIWMAGAGLACDGNQDCYAITGNGGFDGVSQWGESFLKLRYTPPTGSQPASLQIVDHWTPWTDKGRSGAANVAENGLAGKSMATEEVKPVGGGVVHGHGQRCFCHEEEQEGTACPAYLSAIVAHGSSGPGPRFRRHRLYRSLEHRLRGRKGRSPLLLACGENGRYKTSRSHQRSRKLREARRWKSSLGNDGSRPKYRPMSHRSARLELSAIRRLRSPSFHTRRHVGPVAQNLVSFCLG